MKKLLCYLLLLIPAIFPAKGCGSPCLLEKQNEKDMKAQGLKLKADDIYHSVQPSIKDAYLLVRRRLHRGSRL